MSEGLAVHEIPIYYLTSGNQCVNTCVDDKSVFDENQRYHQLCA